MSRRPELTEPILVDQSWANRRHDAVVTTLQSFKGHNTIDVRKHAMNREGKLVPTGKGTHPIGRAPPRPGESDQRGDRQSLRARPDRRGGRMTARPINIIAANIPRIVPDEPGGWFVIKGSYGWLYGNRREALIAVRELRQETRP